MASTEVQPHHWVGQRLRRKEDRRLLTGAGTYTADLKLPGMLHVAMVRSPMARGRIGSVDAGAALAAEGVVAVVTAADLGGRANRLPEGARHDLSPRLVEKLGDLEVRSCPMPVLADGEVYWSGQPVAAVVATDPYAAEDAAELVEVDYEPLPALVDVDAAVEPGAPRLHEHLEDNVAARFSFATGDVDATLAAAPHVLRQRFTVGRQVANAMENRAVLADHDPGSGELTVWATTNRPHMMRTMVGDMLGVPLEKVRFVAPDMGGSFGTGIYSEEVLVPFLALRLGRPVRWVEDRRENLGTTRHARDQVHDLEVGYDDDGRLLALRDRYLVDCGAYNPYAIVVSYNVATHLRGQYRVDAYAFEGRNVLTSKAPAAPVRGAGRPEAVFAMDRALDMVAAERGLDPAEVRRRNLIPAERMPFPLGVPYRDSVDVVYDRGDFPAQLAQALDLAGYDELRARQAARRGEGRLVGVGLSSFVEGSGFGPFEGAAVRVERDGRVLVATGAKSHGQSLETTLAQLCADQLGVHPDQVTVKTGDTALLAYGVGTFASRSAVTAGSAVGIAAGEVRRKALRLAAELLETDPSDLDLAGGTVSVRGAPDRSVPLAAVAAAAAPGPRGRLPEGMAPGLAAEHYFTPPTVTWASGTHVAVVEVDADTGFVTLLRYVTVDDCGQPLNPMVVEGQVHGGVAHGIGNALYEEATYDADGQLLTGSYMDYLLPTSAEVPPIQVGHQEFPSERNPFGIKGVGEGGAVSPPAAVANAIADALRPLAVDVNRVPLHPELLLRSIRRAREATG